MRSSTLAWSAGTLVAALGVAVVVLEAGAGDYADPWGDAASVMAVMTTTGVGLAIVLRRPGNVVGWLLILNGFLLAVSGVITSWAAYALENPGSLPGGRIAAILETHSWPLIFAAIVALGFVFPDGRLPSRRWRAAVLLGSPRSERCSSAGPSPASASMLRSSTFPRPAPSRTR